MTPVAAPADKRFRRSHVAPSPRSRLLGVSWPRVAKMTAIVAVILYGVQYMGSRVLSSPALTVSRITVDGNSRLSRGEVISLLDGLSGQSMVMVDLEQWREKLLASPWVADAAMRRVLPGTVVVAIAERAPVAIGRLGEQLYLLDQRGSVIDEYGPSYAEFDLPIIDGLGASPEKGGALVDDRRSVLAMRLLQALQAQPDLAKRVSQIDVSDPHDAMVILKDDTAYVRIGEDQFTERLQAYLDLAPTLRQRVPDIDYVDLRFGERVYVRPQGGRSRVQPVKSSRGLNGGE